MNNGVTNVKDDDIVVSRKELLKESRKVILKWYFSEGISVFVISRQSFAKKLLWWQADEPAGNFYEVASKAVQDFFR